MADPTTTLIGTATIPAETLAALTVPVNITVDLTTLAALLKPLLGIPAVSTVTTVGPLLVDANGNTWGLTQSTTKGLQVVVNGVTDTTTANCAKIELDTTVTPPKIWQVITSGAAWYKTKPTDAWTSGTPPT